MRNIWVISDTHFGHENIIKYCNRPFSNIEEHDDALIRNWNSRVGPDDTVYVIGDFALTPPKQVQNYLRRLNGKELHNIKGNHDKCQSGTCVTCGGPTYGKWMEEPDGFTSIRDVFLLKLGKAASDWIWMSHYAHARWPHAHHGSLHIFGHSHGGFKGLGRSMDVGVDTNNYFPYHIDEVRKKLNKLEMVEHHGED